MKKKIRNILATMLGAICACGAFVGCDGNEESDAGEIDKSGNTVVKIMFHVDGDTPEGQAYKKRVNAFNAAYKEQKIKASPIFRARTEGAAGYETELTNNKVEGTLADIITFDAPNCAAYAHSKLLYDISELVPQETQDDFLSLNEYNGKLYGLPIQESSAGFYYNKNIFSAAGVDVSGYTVDNPWTFEQFKQVCGQLKSHCTYAVDMRLDATKDETAPYLLYPFIYAAGGSFASEDGLTATGYFNSAATKRGFSFLKELKDAGYTSNAIGATDFFDGKVGMYLSSGWTTPDLDNKYPVKFPDRNSWGLLPYPKDVTAASATGSWCYGITDNHHPDKSASIKLLLWMASAESAEVVTNATGMIPARKSVQTDYEPGSPEDVLLSQLKKTGRARPATIAYPTFSTQFNMVVGGINSGSDLTQLLNTAANALQAQMDEFK